MQDHRLEALTESMRDVMGLDGHKSPQGLLFMLQRKRARRCLGMLRRVVGRNRIQILSLQFHAQVQKDEFSQQHPAISRGKKRRNAYLESTTFLFFFRSQNILFILHLEIVSDIAGC